MKALVGRSLHAVANVVALAVLVATLCAATAGAAEGPSDEAEAVEDAESHDASEAGGMVSASVLEQQLKPEAMAAFDAIDVAAGALRGLQARRKVASTVRKASATEDEAEVARLRGELVALVGGVHLHAVRVAELVERLREVN